MTDGALSTTLGWNADIGGQRGHDPESASVIDLASDPVSTDPIAPPAGQVALPFVVQGDRDGLPVLLLHGFTDSLHSCDLPRPHLPAGLRAYALTQRGHGDAPRPAAGYGPGEFAADLAAFMDHQGIARAVIVGHSLGTSVAQRFALDYPDRTLGVVLIGAIHSWRGNPALVEFAELVATLDDPIDPAFVREFQESTMARPAPPAFLDTIVGESQKLPAHVWRETIAGFVDADLSGELGDIAAPTLILWGEEDGFMPRAALGGAAARGGRPRSVRHAPCGHARTRQAVRPRNPRRGHAPGRLPAPLTHR